MNRVRLILSFVIVVVALNLISCGNFAARIDAKKGNEFYKERKYEEAIDKYKSALKKNPDLIQCYLNIGLSYMALYVPGSTHPKDVEYASQAINYFKEYLKRVDDTNPTAKQQTNEYLVTMYLNADRKDDAIGYFENHLKENPNDTATMQKLAFLYAQAGKFDEALRWYKMRAQVDAKNPEAYYIIGVITWEKCYKFADVTPEQRADLVKTGMDALDQAIKLNPNYADAFLYMNLLYREKAKLISLDPNNVPEDKIDEYNGYLAKAKEYMDKAIELRKKQGGA